MNASNRDADFRWIKEREISGSDVRDVSDEYALLAVQGPNAIEKLGLAPAKPFTFAEEAIDGIEAMVNRTGYTGEDGVEILCMAEDAGALWDAILARGVTPCGLGARDTLRLEVCCPLHGNDIGPTRTRSRPGSAGRARSTRRTSPAPTCCARIKERGPARKLVSFVMEEKAVPRQGMPIDGRRRGHLGLALADARRRHRHGLRAGEHAAPGTELTIDVRGKLRAARVVKRPIYKREELIGRCGVVSRRPQVPPRARLGADRRRRGRARRHLVRAGRARRARALRAAGRGRRP